jgi:hypothetical protein
MDHLAATRGVFGWQPIKGLLNNDLRDCGAAFKLRADSSALLRLPREEEAG